MSQTRHRLAIVFLNARIGFYQEYRAEKSLAALRRMVKALTAELHGRLLKV